MPNWKEKQIEDFDELISLKGNPNTNFYEKFCLLGFIIQI